MINNKVFQDIETAPVMINIHSVHDVDTVCEFIQLLHKEDYPAMEILARPTLDDGLDLLRQLNDRPEREKIHVGVGTIKTKKAAEEVVKLNPDFLVSPAFSRRVLDVAVKAEIPYLPAVSSLQNIQDVLDAFEDVGWDVTLLKLCPVEVLTYETVKIMGAIYPGILFCPTGSVDLETLPEWNKIPCVGPAMESTFIPRDMRMKKQWEQARQILQTIRKITGKEKPLRI
jgi:2-keto-3-deoxy-6-phosphogluconate aldolase